MSLPEFVDRCFGEFNTSKTNANCPELFYFSIFPYSLTLFLILSLFPFQAHKLQKLKKKWPVNRWIFFKMLILALLALLSGIEIVTKHLKKGVELFELLYNLLVFTSMIMSIVSVWFSARSGHRFNGLIISFSIGALLFEGSFLMQLLLKNGYKFPFWSTIRVLLLTILNISSFQQDQHDENNKACPIDSAGFYSILFISWFTKQISIGNKKSLKMEDLFNLPINAKSEFLRKQWREAWEIEKKNKPKNPSIIWAIHRCHGWHIFFISLLQLASDVARNLTNPLLLKWLLSSIHSPSTPLSFSFLCAIGLFLGSEMKSLLSGYYNHGMLKIAIYIQSIFQNAIFEKSLKLNAEARGKYDVGYLVNLMAVDVERICSFIPFATELVTIPVQLLFSMMFLTWSLGISALGGLFVIISVIIFNILSSRLIKRFQAKQMQLKDERTKMCNEVLNGVKLIKLYAWEEAFERKIHELRTKEVKMIKKINLIGRSVDVINEASAFLVAFVVFGLVVLNTNGENLTPEICLLIIDKKKQFNLFNSFSVVFVALAVFAQLRRPMRVLAQTLLHLVQAKVSQARVESFLMENEILIKKGEEIWTKNEAIKIEKGSFKWSELNGKICLSELNFVVKRGELVGIVGEVGAGKSSLLAAILDEMIQKTGKVTKSGSLSYSPQQPWIINTTIRENILLGKPFNPDLFKRIIQATELQEDLSRFEHGELTELGENGVTLSGGQKARLGLARALYQDCEIVLLDDILSAVDVHVGMAIFQKAIGPFGILREKTRLLVTHGLHYAKLCDRVIVMDQGRIRRIATYQELARDDQLFRKLLVENKRERKESFSESSGPHEILTPEDDDFVFKNETQNNEMMQKENLETGRVKNSIYLAYLRTLSLSLSILTISSQILGIGMGIWKSLWLAKWTSETTSDQTISRKEIVQRFVGFTGIGLAESLFLLISTLALMIGCERASLRLHSPLLHSILRAPMEFFDTTPIGRILNRLSRDLEVIDSQLPRTLSDLSANFSQLLLSITMMCIAIPEFLIIVIPFLIINYLILRYYISAARQLKRLEGINRSPILAKFRETIQGAASIRAYKMIDREVYAFFHRIDELARCRFLSYTSNRWLGLRLELLCNITVLVVSIFGLIMSKFDAISPSMLGLCISYALNISEVLYFGVRMVSELETQTISVERIEEYSRLPSEKSWRLSTKPPSNWPSKGQITWTDYSLRYRKELPLIIKQITAKTSENEKVAIVGRTGSGKSSLAIGLYRLIESTSGSLTIDGVDISQIGLHDLRENLTIIPQESVLFSGSIRFNLDPFFTHDDDRLWHVLEECQLKTFFANTQEKLDFQIFEGGLNISMGQRQLICLGRALLRKSKILVLDEATASCDPHTDAIVQSIIRRNFKNSTILAIAHRLNTIADYDRIMVLAKGEIVEFDSPQVLLSNKNSHYSQLLRRINRKLKV